MQGRAKGGRAAAWRLLGGPDLARAYLAPAIVLSLVTNLLLLTPILYTVHVYDRVIRGGNLATLVITSLLALIAVLAGAFLDLFRKRLLIKAGLVLEAQLAARVQRTSLDRTIPQQAAARVVRDFDEIRTLMSTELAVAALDFPWSVLYLGICFGMHPAMGLLGVAAVGALVGLTFAAERKIGPQVRASLEAAAVAYAFHDHAVGHRDLIASLGMGTGVVERIGQERLRMLIAQTTAGYSLVENATLARNSRIALQIVTLALAAALALRAGLSPGIVFALSLLLGRALGPVEQLLSSWRGVTRFGDAVRNVVSMLETPLPARPADLPLPSGALETRDLVLRRGGRVVVTLDRLSVQPGEFLAITGASGAGKSTLLKALVGELTPDEGLVTWGGTPIDQLCSEADARRRGYLPQDVGLFSGLICENISRFTVGESAEPEAMAAVEAAARLAGSHEIILATPQGYRTRLGWRGVGVSGGQAQRIGLARALFGRPRLLVLDEPNAHLDEPATEQLCERLAELARDGVSVIVATHHPGLVARAHRVIEIRDGALFQRSTAFRMRSMAADPQSVAPA
jgi:ATP-binding cassette subfamily C protein